MTNTTIELTFKLTFEEANILIAGLQELPAKIANPIIQKMQQQAQTQLPKPEEVSNS